VDARIIAATNKDLRVQIEEGKFREDLYFRIDVINLHLPPLRQRREDIPDLVRHFVTRACDRLGMKPKEIHRDAMAVLENYMWPGNVRELENVVERTVATESSYLMTVSSLPTSILGSATDAGLLPALAALPESGFDIEAHLDAMRRELMRQALERCGGVRRMPRGCFA